VEVHHLTYERLGAELPGDLEAVCAPCHRAAHAGPAGPHRRGPPAALLELPIGAGGA
jgi:hypothetical protein